MHEVDVDLFRAGPPLVSNRETAERWASERTLGLGDAEGMKNA
jgi:hypothetical protein